MHVKQNRLLRAKSQSDDRGLPRSVETEPRWQDVAKRNGGERERERKRDAARRFWATL